MGKGRALRVHNIYVLIHTKLYEMLNSTQMILEF